MVALRENFRKILACFLLLLGTLRAHGDLETLRAAYIIIHYLNSLYYIIDSDFC